MAFYFTSDTHFGHSNIIKYSNRPFTSTEEMNEALIANWNARVTASDTIWHLGDFAFMQADELEEILKRLNGHKNLVFGNHDKVLRKNKRLLAYFEQTVEKAYIKVQSNFAAGGSQAIVLNHFPELSWDKAHHGAWMLHGHCHGTVIHPWGGKIQDVGVDPMGYKPVSFDELRKMMLSRTFSKHHESKAQSATD